MAGMKIGIIGLGKMGSAIAYRLLQAGHEVIGFNQDRQAADIVKKMGAEIVTSVQEVAQKARIIWLMIPAGDPVDEVLEQLQGNLQRDDIIIDGGNSKFTDSIRRANYLKGFNINFLDCGTSGGLQGKEIGFCLMVGGQKGAYLTIEPLLKAIAAPRGYGHVGVSGAGHYVKMIHNGIEYALLQSYAEGFHLLKEGRYKELDLAHIADIWNHGSVIRSWILELSYTIFKHNTTFKNISGEIAESGTGAWTVQEAKEQNIPVPLIEHALAIRAWSRATGGNYATKVVAMLRNAFGGHAVTKKNT